MISQKRPTIFLTMGDGRGIGPEVIVRALSYRSVRRLADLVVIGDLRSIKNTAKMLNARMRLNELSLRELADSGKPDFSNNAVNVLNISSEDKRRAPLRYVDTAFTLIKKGKASALVTGPVNKRSIQDAGIKFSGHTEYLAKLAGAKNIAMMFASDKLKVTVVTRHIPFKKVSGALTKKKIMHAAALTYSSLKTSFNIKKPRMGVCALNPHAGEGGTVGREEKNIILPAVKGLRRRIPGLAGPLPADSAFNQLYNGTLDALIAMYHDQAMIPVKMACMGGRCVNLTLGLPFIRTSPVHGTAYEIAGRGVADPSSMIEAIKLACRLSRIKT